MDTNLDAIIASSPFSSNPTPSSGNSRNDHQHSPLSPPGDSSSSQQVKSPQLAPSTNRGAFPSKAAAGSGTNPTRRRIRPKIALDPTQPLTAQGKPRARVYVACDQCRIRKTRCDGAKPVCFNCRKRPPEVGECSYEVQPKRRGQDKQPGTRVRAPTTRRAAKRRRLPSGDEDEDDSSESAAHRSGGDESQSSSHVQLSSESCPGRLSDTEESDAEEYDPFPLVDLDAGAEVEHLINIREEVSIPATPSLQFTRDTWWDALLAYYSTEDASTAISVISLTPEQRTSTVQRIVGDLRALFHSSIYWVSFINLPRFFDTLLNSTKRSGMQPSLVLSALAVGKFAQSSEVELGAKGREKALKMVDLAHGALEASLASGWVDIGLIQAAWLIVYFEVQSHPNHTIERGRSSLLLLDSLIRLFSLTTLDADLNHVRNPMYTSSTTTPVVPSVAEPAPFTYSAMPSFPGTAQPGFYNSPVTNLFPARHTFMAAPSTAQYTPPSESLIPDNLTMCPSLTPQSVNSTCNCVALSLGHNCPSIRDVAPAWAGTLIWPENVSEGEFRKEECRRLVWASVMVTASMNSYTAVLEDIQHNALWIKDPSNYALLFPGEALAKHGVPMQPNNVWALYLRSMLLLHSCVRKRADMTMNDAARAQFAMQTWLEIDALENALNQHTCELERTFGFQAREMLFSARMCVSHEFQRYIPQITTNGRLFYRDKAEGWLKLRMVMAERLWQNLQAGIPVPALDHRKPLLIYWFMSHVIKALVLWREDPTLTIALEASKTFVKRTEYLMMFWPSAQQRREWQKVRYELVEACIKSGVPPPEPTLPPRKRQQGSA
ncbi:hypothetical protein L227DRAFT_508824 [Lentinus tigrinus ALCF2SS1-6]|uniref:Zn(2)-C6 fungal-type domain-containing protein n=2 Tax=Lentinus tigrinus TaxID=5365 RepID=A0A5C2RYQ9_9APHY|nr:hypothetical protein L227DRAFT_508824 [Lentinus tigrinus ALCF2SS1-6]